ncbi:unnamed protein product [Paramecium octaurelia]|uniref:Uncharacterized protein n=1 Tax=Paramecium octaurelia TaxID=43137 RepID=A0A8S1SMQ9_PAROT|nr:unnamed protein product [Paramecium octaurelia]
MMETKLLQQPISILSQLSILSFQAILFQSLKHSIQLMISNYGIIFIKKLVNQIQVSIIFFKGFGKEELNINLDVAQFNQVQFKLSYGNIFQSKSNYLTIQIVGLQFLNCPDNNQPQIICHLTCLECDGPTKDDCLSCSKDQNRRYLPNFKQCICEQGTIDLNNECVYYEVFKLKLAQEKPFKEECKYGFFESEGNCFKCPSIINENVISCLECIQNPKIWAQTLICQTTLYTDEDGNVSQQLKDLEQQYVLVGSDLHYCPDCTTLSSTYDLVEKQNSLKIFVEPLNQQILIATNVEKNVMNVKFYQHIQIKSTL